VRNPLPFLIFPNGVGGFSALGRKSTSSWISSNCARMGGVSRGNSCEERVKSSKSREGYLLCLPIRSRRINFQSMGKKEQNWKRNVFRQQKKTFWGNGGKGGKILV